MRKVILLGLVVVVALVVLRKTDLGRLVRVWWHGGKAQFEASIPIETRIEQLKLTIADVQKQFDRLTTRQSKIEAAYEQVKVEVAALKGTLAQRATLMKSLLTALDGAAGQVIFDGEPVEASDLQKRLDRATRDYTRGKALLKARAELLAAKKQIVDASEEQRQQVRQKVADLHVLVATMEARLAHLRTQQIENCPAGATDVAEADRLVGLIDTTLRENEKLQEIKARDGDVSARPEVAAPSRAESLKAARKALGNDE